MSLESRILTGRANAGMLSLVLVISIIVVFITSSLIVLAYYYRLEYLNLDLKARVTRNAHSGVQWLLALGESASTPVVADLFGEGIDSVEMYAEQWGIFTIGYSKAFSRNRSHSLAFIIGTAAEQEQKAALYVVDQNEPLYVGGASFINGDVYLPAAGVRKANIKGKPFIGSALVSGEVHQSQFSIPPLEGKLEAHLAELLDTHTPTIDHPDEIPSSLNVPFTPAAAEVLSIGGRIDLKGQISGKVIIRSSEEVNIRQEAALDGVIIIAPRITIEEGFTGRLQAFATDTLIVGSDAKLAYPSSVCIVSGNSALIEIRSGTTIEGAVISTNLLQQPSGYVYLARHSQVVGQIYSGGPIEFLGVLHGGLICQKTSLRLASGIYENHLVDSHIDSSIKDANGYLEFGITKWANKKGVIKWLN